MHGQSVSSSWTKHAKDIYSAHLFSSFLAQRREVKHETCGSHCLNQPGLGTVFKIYKLPFLNGHICFIEKWCNKSTVLICKYDTCWINVNKCMQTYSDRLADVKYSLFASDSKIWDVTVQTAWNWTWSLITGFFTTSTTKKRKKADGY